MKRKRIERINMDEIIDPMDRISPLPEFIIHSIMSYLPTKDAARSILLSRRWGRVWATFPILVFNQSFFGKQSQGVEAFISYVNKTLQRFCKSGISINNVTFCIKDIDSVLASLLDKWVELSLENHVKELAIHLLPYHYPLDSDNGAAQGEGDFWYSLPQTVFTAKSITTIDLHGCKLEPHISGNTIKFHSLRKLSLTHIQLEEQMIRNLMVACPLLEEFSVLDCWGLKQLSIRRLLELKRVQISDIFDGIERINIEEAPSLQSFTCFRLRNPSRINMVGCHGLKYLFLIGNAGTDEFFHDLTSKFPLLEALCVCHSDALKKIMISSLRLKTFYSSRCKNLVDAQIDAPNLSLFAYDGDTIPFSLINAPCRWELVLVLGHNDSLDAPWYLKLKEFLHHSNQVKILKLSIVSLENHIDLENLFGISIPPNHEVKHPDADILAPKSDYAALVDGLLQTCHPKSLSITLKSEIRREIIVYINDKLKNRESFQHCCSSRPIKCWWHYLEELKAENFEEIENEKKRIMTLGKIRLRTLKRLKMRRRGL